MRIEGNEEVLVSGMKTQVPQCDHLILLPPQAPRGAKQKNDFFERDWSLGWVNFLFQEAGVYCALPLTASSLEKLNRFRFVYLPHNLEGHFKKEDTLSLKNYVQSGGVLILEGPVAGELDFTSVRFAPAKKILKRITQIGENLAPATLIQSLYSMPFQTRGWEIIARNGKTDALMEMENSPVLFRQPAGEGMIYTFGFDFGLLLVALQQGVPAGGARRLKKLFGTQNRVIEPEDLVLRAGLLDNSMPWADLFERFIFNVIVRENPAPRWWYFPKTAAGAFISSHDEEALGPDARLQAMCETEKSMGIRSTCFVISDRNIGRRWKENHSLKKWARGEGPEIGLHWNRFQKWRFKLRRFKFGMHEEPLACQHRFLQEQTGETIRVNRNHYLALGSCYGEHFEKLSAGGFRFDSTYGPNQGGRGYLFGTGYPYYGLSWEGSLTGVLELPFVTQEMWGGADLSYLEKLITESDENFHQCIVVNFHPHYSVLRDQGREMWLGALELAKSKKQWMPTFGEFFAFLEMRGRSALHSRWKNQKLDINIEAGNENATVALPRRLRDGSSLIEVKLDGIRQPFHPALNGWYEEALINLSGGPHRMEAVYEN